jgi:ABC-type branched-subunit amino acid transport system substrate-binding protein
LTLGPGDRVEHFVILSLLGQGGMGQVFAARDTRLERVVALKILQPSPDGSEAARESTGAARLLREARSAASLEHPNVVVIYEIGSIRSDGDETGCPFIAMELVKGKSLRAFVGHEEVPIAERVRWLIDIARALAAAHRAKIVHRDMKPENVMVRDDGVIKVLDFGIAKRVEPLDMGSTTSSEILILPSLTGKGVAVGTPHYMAPEQMRREEIDGRADQFAWGVIAYELLTGTLPWGREVDPLELVAKLLTESPRPLEDVRPDVPGHVAMVVARAMSKRKVDRFPTMDDLVASLSIDVAPRDSMSTGSRAAPAAVVTRAGRRRVGWYSSIAVALALAAVALVVQQRGARRRGSAPLASSSVVVGALEECQRSTECVAKLGGAPAVCTRSRRCAAIESSQCKALYEKGDLTRDDTVWVGAMFPLSGGDARYGITNRNAVELARRDFASESPSLRAPDGGMRSPAVALVVCDDAAGSDAIAAHLVNDVGVPAVIGFGGAKSVELSTSWFVPNGTLVVASISQSPLLARVPQPLGAPRLVWRSTYDNTQAARAIAAVAATLEARLRANGALRPNETMRVAVARRKDAGNTAFAETLFRALVINGKPALENGDAYREFSFDAQAGREEYSAVAPQIARFRPTLVVSSANVELIAMVEDAWPKEDRRRPHYQTPFTVDDELLRFVGTSADRRARVAGITSVSTTVPNARFVVHYNETFDEPITRAKAPNSSYDAFYLLAYASYALAGEGGQPATGAALARAIGRLLPPGPKVDVGRTDILGAWGNLSRGKNIDLEGATGSLDFDPETGEAPVNLAVVCASLDSRGSAAKAIESGVVYLAKEGRLVGESRCP